MKSYLLKKVLPHVMALFIFLTAAMIYCKPSLEGKVLNQSDVIYWKAMAQSSFKYKETHGSFPLWTNSMFCGMPAYFIAMDVDNTASLVNVHGFYLWLLPKPVCFFVLLCVGFYLLSIVFNINPYICILGSIAYAYASYSSIIVAVGHETKILAMGYGPALLAAILLLYKKRYWSGGALIILFTSLLVAMNHLQINFYFLLIAIILTGFYAAEWIKNKDFSHLLKSGGIVAIAGIIGVCTNMVTIATAYDYSNATRKGTLNMNDSSKAPVQSSGYSIDYAFGWSYGIKETFSLLVPNIYGGVTHANLSEDSRFIKLAVDKKITKDIPVNDLIRDWPQYWGAQPSTSGPVYAGAVICVLFILGLVSVKGKNKWWILTACSLAILMAWGKNFQVFNTFVFNNLPFYDKFRAPSMILVIPQLLFPLLAAMGLHQFLFDEKDKKIIYKQLKISGIILAALLVTASYYYVSFEYKGPKDEEETITFIRQLTSDPKLVNNLYTAFIQDRQSLFANDLLRSTIFVMLIFLVLWFTKRFTVKPVYVILGLLLLTSADLFGIGRRYLNDSNYQDANTYDTNNYAPTNANLKILKDTGYYRVLDRASYSDPRTYYYHNSVEGYSPAKLSLIEDLFTNQSKNPQLNNMLNAKYVIRFNEKNEAVAELNNDALGNCWLVKSLHFVNGPVAAMKALNNIHPKDTAIIEQEFKAYVQFNPRWDSSAVINLIKNDNDIATYHFKAATDQFAVFSEVYYERGWKAYIDNKETLIIKTDYALRGLSIPAGEHVIKFEFKPASYYNSVKIAVIASVLGWLCILFALLQECRLFYQTRQQLN